MDQLEPWLSVKEIARYLGVCKWTVYNWIRNGTLPTHRVGRCYRFRVSEVDRKITKKNHLK